MFLNPGDNRWLYNIVDNAVRSMEPLSEQYLAVFKQLNRFSDAINLPTNFPGQGSPEIEGVFKQSRYMIRSLAGQCYMSHMLTDMYHKPEWGIDDIKIKNSYFDVVQEVVMKKPFCELLRFRKLMSSDKECPKILIVAPMSGHYSTLLRETVRGLLPHYDVYITDWVNARDVPLTEGSFDLSTFAGYMKTFMRELSPDLHVMAVCQSTVPVLIALSIMSADDDPKLPLSAILLGGPIDTDQAPTVVNELAETRGDDWFQQNVISIVPNHYKGYMRLVYPGFMQLSGFMSMNPQKHLEKFYDAIHDFAKDEMQDALKTIHFYKEYFSVMDLTAEFYMQTINTVFQEKLLVKGRLKTRGRYAQLQDISKIAILAIEGEHDDITGIGQTKSVLDLATNLPKSMKKYMLADGVGHYGLFSGSKFLKNIVPEICSFTNEYAKRKQ
jgi:poly(3-hydroxybutyrate) depolymerase